MEMALDKGQLIAGVAFAAVLFAFVLYFSVVVPGGPLRAANWGFGPDWDCGNPVGRRDLVCIETPAPKRN